jgi:hypothetical protein
VSLRLKPKVGQVMKYKMTMVTTVPQMGGSSGPGKSGEMTITGTITQKVDDVAPNGDVTISTTMETTNPMAKKPSKTTTKNVYDQYGNPKNAKLDSFGSVAFPKNPVKVGSSWPLEMPLPPSSGAKGSVTGKHTLTKISDGGKTAVIRTQGSFSMKMPMGKGKDGKPATMTVKTKADMVANVDVASGMPTQVSGTVDTVTTMGGMQIPSKVKLTMTKTN